MPEKKKLFNQNNQNMIFTAVISVIIIFATHGFAFSNLMYSHDGLVLYETNMTRLKLGRWAGHYYVRYLREAFSTPWMTGVILAACLVASILIVSELFEFKGIKAAVTATVMSTNIALTALIASFTKDVDVYGLALLFAAIAVLLREKLSGIWNILMPAVCIAVSMGFYQAYASCAIVLFVLLLVKKIVANTDNSIKPIIREGLVDIVILVAGFVLYYIIMRVTIFIGKAEMSSGYNSPDNLGKAGISGMLAAIPQAYKTVAEYFFKRTGYNGYRMIVFNAIILLITLIAIVIFVIRKDRRLPEKALLVVLLILLPLAANAVYIVSDGVLHHLMIYAFCLLYLLPLLFFDKTKLITPIACVLIIFIGFHNFAYANGAYACKKLIYDNTLNNMQAIWRDVEGMEGYEKGSSRVAVMGNLSAEELCYENAIFDKYSDLSGMTPSSITYDGIFRHMLDEVMGKKARNLRINDEEISNAPGFTDMPSYPQDGYVAWIDDTIVVKLSD